MGTKIDIRKFCKEKHELSPLLTRAVFKNGKVFCQKSSFVNLGVVCDGKQKSLCNEAKGSCLRLRRNFAINLNLSDWALEGRYLNCKFSVKNKLPKKIVQ